MLTAGKVRCSPASPCSCAKALCAWLRVALLLPSPALRAAALALPGRDGKAGSPIEPESRICEVAARTTVSRSGLRVTTPTGVQLRVCPLQRCGLRDRALGRPPWRAAEHGTILPGMTLRGADVADAAVAMVVVVPTWTKRTAHCRAASRSANPLSGNSGRYFAVRNSASAKALSSLTRGRE